MFVAPFMPQEGDRLPNFRHEVRNRPHPNKAFLYWKQPRTNPLPSRPIAYTNDIAETFYQDYSRRGIPAGNKYGDRDETPSVQVNPWRKPVSNGYYEGSALDPLRSSSRVSNMSMLERPVSKPHLRSAVRAGDLRNTTPSWSSNLIDRDTVRNQSRQLRSRISVRPESVQPTAYIPKEVSDFTNWLQTSEPSQRVQFLDYLRSLTTVLEENELDTYLKPSPVKQAFNTKPQLKKRPTLSYQTQTRIKNQKNARITEDFIDKLDGESIDIHQLLP